MAPNMPTIKCFQRALGCPVPSLSMTAELDKKRSMMLHSKEGFALNLRLRRANANAPFSKVARFVNARMVGFGLEQSSERTVLS